MKQATRSTRLRRSAIVIGLSALIAGLAVVPLFTSGRPAQSPTAVAQGEPQTAGAEQEAHKSRLRAALGHLPLYFVQNRGQEDARVAYYVQGQNTAVYFADDGITFALTAPRAAGDDGAGAARVPVRRASTAPERAATPERWAVKLDFIGASRVTPTGQDQAPAVVSYFKGREGGSRAALETYRGVTYTELWPGIDLVYTGAGGQLKSTFIVKPGADPSRIRLAYRGASGVRVTDAGQLEVSTPVGGFADDRPYAYQDGQGGRREVPVAFALAAAAEGGAWGYGFTVGDYDRTQTLVLDPSLLVYAGYVGGASTDQIYGLAVDAAGNAYVAGVTASATPSFPAKVGPDLTYSGNYDAFVAKIKADGSDFVYLGYIGGSNGDHASAIAVDAAGNAYVAGRTNSDPSSFPVTVGPDLVYNGGISDAFVCKVTADGTALAYCGYIGGAGLDEAYGIAVDAAGNAYVAGTTDSSQATFPVAGGPALTHGGADDAFVAKVKADGSGLVYAGYIGGAGADAASGIAVDAAGSAYVAGRTASNAATFPVKLGPDLVHNGGYDAFVAKVAPNGSGLVYAGYIGGAAMDDARAIAVDAAGNAYVTGYTESDETTFAVKVGPSLSFEGVGDAFVAKVKADGTGLVYAGYIGGIAGDQGNAIAVDAAGSAYVAGTTYSNEGSFPVFGGPSLQHAGSNDAFVAKVRADGGALAWAGYIGGTSSDYAMAVAVDAAGHVYVAGSTGSSQSSFPVAVGPSLTYGGGTDGFVAKMSQKAELYQSFVGISATAIQPGATFNVADMVANAGLTAAPASSTHYYLAKGTVRAAGDIALGSRLVPSLVPGGSNMGGISAKVPLATALGAYHVIACADDAHAVTELDEANNCKATTSVLNVARPNLYVQGVTNPPATFKGGDHFWVSDVTANGAAIASGASTTRYYASTSGKKDAAAILLTGTRKVPALAAAGNPGSTHFGSASVTVPGTIPAGTYWLLACADDTKLVKESDDNNNCVVSPTSGEVQKPNLAMVSIANPPSTVKRGQAFQVSDTVKNIGSAPVGASTNRYYFSKDGVKGSDTLLSGSRAVPALAALQSSTGPATVTAPVGMIPGTYFLFACADDLKKVAEGFEGDNCAKALTTVNVTQ